MSTTWQKDLRDMIAGLTTVSATTDQVWWNQAKSGAPGPHIVLSQVGAVRDVAHEGQLTLGNARVQASCYGITAAQAVALRDAINDALVGGIFTVAGGNAPASGNEFPAILHGGDLDFPLPEVDLFRANTDLRLTYRLAA